ncbi:MAG: ABC transporter ATP-binding protein [Lachnospiraceae bacterium]|nr:ABC transporter ATP-binding protein [Lachnospiraceae bacterium]
MFLEVEDLVKFYGEGENRVKVLKGISTGVEKGEMCVIQGPSGSGKSTFLNCIGGLEVPDGGSIKVDGTEIAGMSQDKLSDYRRDKLGFIFQFYNLVPDLTVRENIEVCEFLSENPLQAEELMETLGIAGIGDKFPAQLSGGQQQRVAIARALIKNPVLLLCDEPTGALDSKTSKSILILLETINRKYGTTMMIVTHNNAIRKMVHRVIIIKDGEISECSQNEVLVPAAELTDL